MVPPKPHTAERREKLATNSPTDPTTNARDNKLLHGARKGSSSRSSGRACSAPRRKTSEVIEVQTARDVFAALVHAEHVGLLPNRMMTIDLERGGVADPVAAVGRLMKLAGDAVRRKGDLAYIWVRETGPVVGNHVHVLLHLPAMRKDWLGRRMPRWLKRCGIAREKGVTRTRVIRGAASRTNTEMMCSELYTANLHAVRNYVLKHCSEDVQRDLGIIGKGPCIVVGKRVSISENLHRKARSRCSTCVAE